MEGDFITRREHEEFARRMDDEDDRQNKRLAILEDSMKKLEDLTVAIEKMSVSISTMATEIKKQGERLEAIEAKPGKLWENIVSDVIKLVVAAAVGFTLARLGLS